MHICIIGNSCTPAVQQKLPLNTGTLLLSLASLFDVNSSGCVVDAEQMKLHCLESEQLGLPIS